jgi:hypothetical protein
MIYRVSAATARFGEVRDFGCLEAAIHDRRQRVLSRSDQRQHSASDRSFIGWLQFSGKRPFETMRHVAWSLVEGYWT